jgi:hypothetical protein
MTVKELAKTVVEMDLRDIMKSQERLEDILCLTKDLPSY